MWQVYTRPTSASDIFAINPVASGGFSNLVQFWIFFKVLKDSTCGVSILSKMAEKIKMTDFGFLPVFTISESLETKKKDTN
jgi:hypothetical protein